MRLVDADALIKWINESRCADCPDKQEDRCAACQWDDAIMSIETAPTVGGWISVKDRLPETGRLALVYGSAGAMTIARHIANNEWLVPGIFSTVTHWMPLPEPPKEVSGDEKGC